MVSPVRLYPPSEASYVTVPLLGSGPGVYLDFETFNFQVPRAASAAPRSDDIASPNTATRIERRVLPFMVSSLSAGLGRFKRHRSFSGCGMIASSLYDI